MFRTFGAVLRSTRRSRAPNLKHSKYTPFQDDQTPTLSPSHCASFIPKDGFDKRGAFDTSW